MPKAFHHAGYLVGSISTVVIGLILVYCIHILIKVHYELCKRNKVNEINHQFQGPNELKHNFVFQVPSMDYPTIAKSAMLEGPRCLHRFAPYIV